MAAHKLHRFYQIDGVEAVSQTLTVMCSADRRNGQKRGMRFMLKLADGLWYHMKVNHSTRYECFSRKLSCARCGVVGERFALESQVGKGEVSNAHGNLYGIRSDGKEVLMTQDHIVPRSMGGTDHISNLRTMCEECNMLLGRMTAKLAKLGVSVAVPADAGAFWALGIALEHEMGNYRILYSNGNAW